MGNAENPSKGFRHVTLRTVTALFLCVVPLPRSRGLQIARHERHTVIWVSEPQILGCASLPLRCKLAEMLQKRGIAYRKIPLSKRNR